MTIAVGFVCPHGIVLGADSQASFERSVLKRSVTSEPPSLRWKANTVKRQIAEQFLLLLAIRSFFPPISPPLRRMLTGRL